MVEKAIGVDPRMFRFGELPATSTATEFMTSKVEVLPTTTHHFQGVIDPVFDDSETRTHFQDEVIRELAAKLAEARRVLESMRAMEARIPDRFTLMPSQEEHLRLQISRVEQVHFQFIED